MNSLKKMLAYLTSQVNKTSVTLGTIETPHKIKDDNQSITSGVINEKSEPNLRSEIKPIAKRQRVTKPKRIH